MCLCFPAIVSIVLLSVPGFAQELATVSGTVVDNDTGAVIRGAEVQLVGTALTTVTDLDGRFVLRAEPGTYQVLATLDNYFPMLTDTVELSAENELILDLLLPRGEVAGEEITVTASAIEASTEAALLLERRSAARVSDSISSEEISANDDSDVAGAMSRVVGASLVDDKYLYVRGLGDRFMSATQLNGSLLPSTETDRKVVPLDLFPASLVDNIKLEKTYTPDMPGEFSGALVSIETVEFPSVPTLKLSFTSGFNSLTTSKDVLSYPGGNRDWLGFDDGRRDLPDNIPDQRLARGGLFSPGFTPAELETFGESFENVWNPQTETGRPNYSMSLLAGNTWGKLGVVYGLSYGNKLQNQEISRTYYGTGSTGLLPRHIYNLNRTSNTVRLGNTLNFAYKLNENHKLLFKNFFSTDGSDEARLLTGFNNDFDTDILNQRLRFIEETIISSQVAGEHFFGNLNGLLEWRVAYSEANRDEPDLREVLYVFNAAGDAFRFRDQSQSGFREFISARDKIWDPGVDFTKFFTSGQFVGSFQFGAAYTVRDRNFDARRLRFGFVPGGSSGIDLSQDPESLFTPEFIGPNFEIQEDTRNTDNYIGDHQIRAAYGMADVFIGQRWRFIGGLRVEDSAQVLDTFDLFNGAPIQTRLDDTDYLPSFNVVYSLTPQQNIRAAYSRTVARPNFRELAPFDFTDVTGGWTVIGNEDLIGTKIDNFDVRWEYFLSGTDLVSGSVFYKDFQDPIETILQPTAQIRRSFDNVEGARNWGIETEVRKNLGDLSASLDAFALSANYTFVSSEVQIGDVANSILTTSQRPLAGQSENVFNGTLEYQNPRWWGHTSRLLYNMVGRRITDVGAFGIPDVYQEAQHALDFVVEQSFGDASRFGLKFAAGNLLDDEKEYTQGGLPYMTYREGRTFSIGLSYQIY